MTITVTCTGKTVLPSGQVNITMEATKPKVLLKVFGASKDIEEGKQYTIEIKEEPNGSNM